MPQAPGRRLPLGEDEWVALGSDRWALWHHPDVDEEVRVRLERRATSWGIGELVITAPAGTDVKASHLRLLNLGRLTSAISDPDYAKLILEPEPGVPELAPAAIGQEEARRWSATLPFLPVRSDLRLHIPPKGQRGDDFYLAVAMGFSVARARGRGAARAIAEANGVPVSTVYSWIKEYKRRSELREAEERARRQREERCLTLLALTDSEYEELVVLTGKDPLGLWDASHMPVGPTEEVVRALELASESELEAMRRAARDPLDRAGWVRTQE